MTTAPTVSVRKARVVHEAYIHSTPIRRRTGERGQGTENHCRPLIWQSDHTFYSPLHALDSYTTTWTTLDGMEHCFEVLGRCDELVAVRRLEESRGLQHGVWVC